MQYDEQVSLLQEFVRAERSGYFALHLYAIAHMQPYFHAARRLQYAKSSQVYMPTMKDLEKSHGYFTIRRKVWFEQLLMRALKTTGGLTRGRQIRNSSLLSENGCGLYHCNYPYVKLWKN